MCVCERDVQPKNRWTTKFGIIKQKRGHTVVKSGLLSESSHIHHRLFSNLVLRIPSRQKIRELPSRKTDELWRKDYPFLTRRGLGEIAQLIHSQ